MRADGGDDVRRFAAGLGDLGAEGRVRAVALEVHGLAQVVQQAGPARDVHAAADFGGHRPGQMRDFDGVAQDILAVAGAEHQLAQQTLDFRMQAADAGLDGGALARFLDALFGKLAGFLDGLFDAPRVDAPVADQSGQGDLGNLAANRIEGRYDDGLRGVIYDQVHAGELLEGADVSALAADDPAFHLVAR